MSQERERIQISLLGETFTIKGETNQEEMVRAGQFLNEQLVDLKMRCPALSQKHLAILAAVNMTVDLLRLKKDYEDLVLILDK